jgi:hypothetical protein
MTYHSIISNYWCVFVQSFKKLSQKMHFWTFVRRFAIWPHCAAVRRLRRKVHIAALTSSDAPTSAVQTLILGLKIYLAGTAESRVVDSPIVPIAHRRIVWNSRRLAVNGGR